MKKRMFLGFELALLAHLRVPKKRKSESKEINPDSRK
jgi:hypothetical protein